MSATGLTKDMMEPKTKDSFAPNDAPFCSTVAKNGESFEEYVAQPEHIDVALKIINSVVPWLNVRFVSSERSPLDTHIVAENDPTDTST